MSEAVDRFKDDLRLRCTVDDGRRAAGSTRVRALLELVDRRRFCFFAWARVVPAIYRTRTPTSLIYSSFPVVSASQNHVRLLYYLLPKEKHCSPHRGARGGREWLVGHSMTADDAIALEVPGAPLRFV